MGTLMVDRWTGFCGHVWLLALAGLGSLVTGIGAQEQTPPPWRNFRRVFQGTAVIPEPQGQTTWTRVSRKEFEAAVATADRKEAAAARPPWLSAARYEATWDSSQTQLVGTATWDVHNPYPFPGLVTLEPCNLALGALPSWGDRPAILGSYRERPLQLLVDRSGTQRLTLDWSVRTETRPDGQWCRIQLPPAAFAELSILLPDTLRLECPAQRQAVTLSGRDPAPTGMRRWLVTPSGRANSDITLVSRPREVSTTSALLKVDQRSEYELDLDGVQARFLLDGEIGAGRFRQMRCQVEEPLHVHTVLLAAERQPLPWRWEMVQGQRILVILLPAVDKRVSLEVLATVKPSGVGQGSEQKTDTRPFSCPGLRPLDPVHFRETIQVRWNAALDVSRWDFGGFRPVDAPRRETRLGISWEVLTMESRAGQPHQRPSARVSFQMPDVSVQQESWWHVGTDEQRFMVRSVWRVQEGRVHTLQARVPTGWVVEDVTTLPPEQLASWSHPVARPGEPLQVELRAPVVSGQTVTLQVRMHAHEQHGSGQKPLRWAVPHLEPLGVFALESQYAITLQRGRGRDGPVPLFAASVQGLAARAPPSPLANQYLWQSQHAVPDYYFETHLAHPGGVLETIPLSAPGEVSVLVEVSRQGSSRIVNYDLQIQPQAGRVHDLTVKFSAPPPTLRWQSVGRGHEVRWQPRAQGGELVFAKPVSESVHLRASCTIQSGAEIPLLIPGVAAWSGRLILRPGGLERAQLQGHGLEKLPVTAPLPTPLVLGDVYRYDLQSGGVRFREPGDAELSPTTAHASLTCQVQANGTIDCEYSLVVQGKFSQEAQLQLPPGGTLMSVEVDGKPLEPIRYQQGILTFPAGTLLQQLRLSYQRLAPPPWWGGRYTTAQPTWLHGLTIQATDYRWRLPREIIPFGGQRLSTQSHLTEWSFDGSSEASFLWIRHDVLLLVGLLLGMGCLGVLLLLPPRFFWQLAVGMMLLVGVTALILPSTWVSLALFPLGGLVTGLAARYRHLFPLAPRMQGCVLLAVMVGLLPLSARYCVGTEDVPTVVYILPGPPDKPEEQFALVPTNLWQELQRRERQVCAGLPPYLLTRIEQQGQVAAEKVSWQAELALHVFVDEPVEVPFVLGTSRLRRLSVDNAPANAQPLRRGDGVRVRVTKAGPHTILAAWEASVRQHGTAREVRSLVPRTAVGQARAVLPSPARGVVAENVLGRQVTETRDSDVAWRGDLGDRLAWSLRWHGDLEENTTARVEEFYHWEVQPHGITQRAWLNYEVTQGAAREWRVVLPAGARLRHLEVTAPGREAPRVRSWKTQTVENVGQVLIMELDALIQGRFCIHLEMLRPLPEPVLFPWHLPGLAAPLTLTPAQPLNVVERGGGWGSYTVDGFETSGDGEPGMLQEVGAEQWSKQLPLPVGVQLPPQRAFRWLQWPPPRETVLKLRPAPPSFATSQHLSLAITPGEVKLHVAADLQGGPQLPALVRWQVPAAMNVTQLSGAMLSSWSREGNVLFLWLRPERGGDATLELTGWLPGPDLSHAESFALPRLLFPDARELPGKLTIQPARAQVLHWVANPDGLPPLDGPSGGALAGGTSMLLPLAPRGSLRVELVPSLENVDLTMNLGATPDGVTSECKLQANGRAEAQTLRVLFPAGVLVLPRTPGRETVITRVRRLADGRWEWTFQSTEPVLPLTFSFRLPWQPGQSVMVPNLTVLDALQTRARLRLSPDLDWVEPSQAGAADSEGWQVPRANTSLQVKRRQ